MSDMQQRRDTGVAWALGVSLALHALLLAYAAWLPPRAPSSLSQPIVVDLVSVPPLPPPPPEEKPATPAPEPPKPEPKKLRAPSPAPAAESPPPEAPAPEPEPLPDTPVQQDAPTDAPTQPRLMGPGLALGSGPAGLSATWALSLDAGVIAEAPTRGVHAPERPEDLAKDAAKRTLGRGRVERGLVHTYYAQLGKALIKSWDADRAVGEHGLKGFMEQTKENTQVWNNIWRDKAAEFGRTGNPFGDDAPDLPAARPLNDRLPGGIDLQARKATQKAMAEQFKSTKRATIRVVQGKDGRLLHVELVEPSRDPYIDKEAMKDVRAAAEKLPPPPPEALEGRDGLSSLWQFELIVSITPPVPTFTFEFDEALGFVDARLPLDRRIYKKVRLVSVE